MSNQIAVQETLQVGRGLEFAESSSSSLTPSMARIQQVHTSIMGEVESNGKKINAEMIPVGYYKTTLNDGTIVYSETVSIKVKDILMQLTRWDSEEKVMHKTVLSHDLNKNVKDNLGGFNLGREPGYIKWEELDDETKNRYRQIKRVYVYLGKLSIPSPLDEEGNPMDRTIEDEFFVMDVKNRDSLASLNNVKKELYTKNKRILDQAYIFLSGKSNTMDGGNTFGTIDASVGYFYEYDKVKDAEESQAVHDFISWVNHGICAKWDEMQGKQQDALDGEFVAEFVDT